MIVARGTAQDVRRHVPAQVAVGDDPDQPAVLDRRRRSPAACGSSAARRRRGWRSGATSGRSSPLCISCSTRSSWLPSLPPGMEHGEVARREAAPLEQRHRQRVAQRQHAGGRGGGRQAHRAGLADLGQQQAESAASASVLAAPADQADQRDREAARVEDQVAQLGRLAGVRQAPAPRPAAVIMPRSPWLASAGWT